LASGRLQVDKNERSSYYCSVGRGEQTRQAILERATQVASRMGLAGVTIGTLADELDLSKSGLFAHFRSKEALQIQTLAFAAQLFVERVVRPALKAPRGEPRVRAVFEGWLGWARSGVLKGGCLFVAAATELDDREGPVRDELVRQQKDWLELLANVARSAIAEGHFRRDLDPAQFAYELHGIMLAYHHAQRLMRDTEAESRARRAFEAQVTAARSPAKPRAAAGRAASRA
jgi:AcrR family transcriptional regulator